MTRRMPLLAVTLLLGGAFTLSAASPQIYDESANANRLISAAIRQAQSSRKNIVLDFGANWCPDCHALEAQMSHGELGRIVSKHFLVVHISVGRFDRNLDVARKYGIPLKKGIPALAVLDSNGKLLFSQKEGQFENARALNSASFLAFFKRWAPAT